LGAPPKVRNTNPEVNPFPLIWLSLPALYAKKAVNQWIFLNGRPGREKNPGGWSGYSA
jgi:hypothetical protein